MKVVYWTAYFIGWTTIVVIFGGLLHVGWRLVGMALG